MKIHRFIPSFIFLLCAASVMPLQAADIKEIARAKALQNQKAIVTIKLIIKTKTAILGQSQDKDSKVEAIGTVIDPDGLTVTDVSLIDSSSILNSLGLLGGAGIKVDTQIKEAAIILEDGAEIPADVVLKDTELGLAFIRPRATSRKFDFIELKKRSDQPQPLDSIFAMGRLDKFNNRAVTLSLDTILAVVKGPRTFFVSEKETSSIRGCMAYFADGDPLGMYVLKPKPIPSSGAADDNLSLADALGGEKDSLMFAILPVNDIIDAAQQAKKAKAPAKPAK